MKFTVKSLSISLIFATAFFAPVLAQTGYYEYSQEDRDMKLVGRVYRAGSDEVIVEAWPTPRRLRPKIERIEFVSPSGKRYKVSEIENFPMSQLATKRAQYGASKRRQLAMVSGWLVKEASANCGPGHGSSEESSSGNHDRRSAEAFAGFGLLAGVAGTQEKEWVSSGRVRVKEEPGMWKLAVQVADNKNNQHMFAVPFDLFKISTGTQISMAPPPLTGDREVTSLESVDANGNKIFITLNPDGSRTVVMTAANGQIVSRDTRPSARGARKTWLDPETGLRISEWENPDGSVIRRAEDEHGNWSEGTRFPGGKKDPPASMPQPEPIPAQQPESEPTAVPEESGPPSQPSKYTSGPGTTPGTVTGTDNGDSVLDTLDEEVPVYGEELNDEEIVGILLQREDDEWVPAFGGHTNVYAKIYQPDLNRPGVWVPSDKKRKMTVRFVERSEEKGRCLNRDLDAEPQVTPDLFMKPENNLGTTCTDDPAGTRHYGSCTTNDEQNSFTFVVQSEDFGSFSKMEAACDGCTPLVPVYMGHPERYPLAVEEHVREKQLVRVPKDTNNNQISDGYPPDKQEFFDAGDDSEDTPRGNGVKGDGLTAYEEYRGFYDKYGAHNCLDWKKKELFIQNLSGLPGIDLFGTVAGLNIVKIDHLLIRDRVVNFNSGHAHAVDQHCLILVNSPVTGNGLLGRTNTSAFGPPINCSSIEIFPGNHSASYPVQDTVVHELGHAIAVRHHGDTSVWYEEFYPPGTWRDYNPLAGMTLAGVEIFSHTHDQPTLCGKTLPATVQFGEKHNQSSGAVDCYMRYEYHGKAFRQEDDSIDCIGTHPGFTGFCSVTNGTGFNAGNRVAGNPTIGNCKGQMVINDIAA